MSIFEVAGERVVKLEPAGLSAYGLSERADLLRLLRFQVDVVAPDVLVVGEGVGGGDEAERGIDLLGVDKHANLVVVALERTEDEGRMELHAIRHAAMVSKMTFDTVANVFAGYLETLGSNDSARDLLLAFLNRDSLEGPRFPNDVRIVLASAEFSRDTITSVVWLNEHGLDIRCVRLRPYSGGSRLFIDVQQIIPLPEAIEEPAGARHKKAEERQAALEQQPEEPEAARPESQSGGLWFVNVGMDDADEKAVDTNGRGSIRHWDNCVRYGYIAAGGAPRYADALKKLEPGAHVVAYQKGEGYLGYGVVTRPAEPIHKFRVEGATNLARALKQTEHNDSRSADRWEYAVGVDWRKTFPLNNAKWFKGGFANQTAVCQLTDPETVSFVRSEFAIPAEEPL